jgi:hypothetical protein
MSSPVSPNLMRVTLALLAVSLLSFAAAPVSAVPVFFFTVSETNGINALGQLRDFPGLVNGITEGTGAIVYDDNGESISTFFAFAIPITAFGLDITTNPGSTVTISGSVSDSIVLATNQPMFWGVIDFAGLTWRCLSPRRSSSWALDWQFCVCGGVAGLADPYPARIPEGPDSSGSSCI